MSYTRRTELTCTQAELTTYADKVLLANELLAVVKTSGRRDIYYGDGTTPISGLSPSVSYDELNALKTAAETAKTAAAGSATNAAESERLSGISATAASASALSASESAAAALQSAESASTSATAAESAQTAAETARTNACNYSTSAGNSATAAAGSATDASSSASAAASSASAAGTSAALAEAAKTAAASSASAAATSEANAASSTQAYEDRIHEVEQWEPLVDQFELEEVYVNQQNPLPVINVVERYNYSTFVGWACPIGHPTDFDTLIFSVKNRSTEDYVENVRCFITLGNNKGDVLVDEVMSNVHIAPGEWRKIEFHFSKLIENTEEAELYAGFSCDQRVSFMGGYCGTILYPPTYGVVTYRAPNSPSYAAMMKNINGWEHLYDPKQDNTGKVDFLIAKQAHRYGLGEFREDVRDIAGDVAEEKIEEAMSEKSTFELPPRVILPDVFHAVVGDTLQLFYRGIVEHPNPYNYNIEFRCDIGKNTPRYFEVTPVESNVGDHMLTVRVRDHLDNILAEATTVLRVHAVGEAPSLRKNILCVGDSLTGSGTWCKEALRRFTETGGTPAGLGLSNIRFIGTKKNGECGYEGYGGWTWDSYLAAPTATKLGMWVYCSHDKDTTDQHSLWEDASGNIWSMETIESTRIKFTRYQDHTAPMPLGAGTLHHYQNATHTADIDYDETVYAEGNPFWDSDEGQVNFRTYCERNGFDRVDYMVTLLSWNGMAASTYSNSETLIANHVTNAKRLIRILHEQYPNAKVKMMGIQLPSVNGGTGHSYGANGQYSNWYGLVRSVMNMNRAYQEMANEDEFSSYVELIDISGQFDSEYNMQRQSKTVNTRSASTELVGTNGVHPSTEGYYQIGDAAYRALVPELTGAF